MRHCVTVSPPMVISFQPYSKYWDTNARSLADRAIGASLLNETGRHTLAYQDLVDSPVLRRATSFCTFAMFTCDIPPIPAWLYAMVFHRFNLTSLRPLETGTRAHRFKLGASSMSDLYMVYGC